MTSTSSTSSTTGTQPAGTRARTGRWLLAAAVLAASTLSACGLQTSGGLVPSARLAGPLASTPSLDGASVVVGSKNFSEQILLGKITGIVLQAAGADVRDLTNIPGSVTARQALTSGQIDMMWDYTGTAWITTLGHENGIANQAKQYAAVRDEDLAKHHLVWLKPAPMNNTYAFATTAATARRLGVSKLSDLAKVPVADRTFCVESEFASRNDGFQPMLKAYGVPLGTGVPRGNVRTLDTGAVYEATARSACTFGEVFTTDGRIKSLHLTVLKDDRHFFPAYNAALTVRGPVMKANPRSPTCSPPSRASWTTRRWSPSTPASTSTGRTPARWR